MLQSLLVCRVQRNGECDLIPQLFDDQAIVVDRDDLRAVSREIPGKA